MNRHTSPCHGGSPAFRTESQSLTETEGTDDLLPFPDAPIQMDYSTDGGHGFYTIPWARTQSCGCQPIQPLNPINHFTKSEDHRLSDSTMDGSEENPMISLDVEVQDPPIRRLLPVLLDIASLMLKKINVVIVGDLALRAYGLDQEVGNIVQVAVRDAHMEKAKHQLLSQGYVEDLSPDTESIYTYQLSSIRTDLLTDGSYRLVRQTDAGPIYLTLSHAAVWNLTLGMEYKRSIQMLPHTHIPFPKFDVYLKAALRTTAGLYRGRAITTRHYATRGIDEHAKKMIAICPPEIKASLRSADRFMAKYFPCPNKTRDWESYVCAQAVRVYLNEISFKEAERRLPRVDSVMQALAESIPKSPRQRKVWRKIHLTTDGDKDKNETSVITSIEPRSSVNSKHRIVYRIRRVVDRINRERQMQGTNANPSVII